MARDVVVVRAAKGVVEQSLASTTPGGDPFATDDVPKAVNLRIRRTSRAREQVRAVPAMPPPTITASYCLSWRGW
jgi:hypothetical protein